MRDDAVLREQAWLEAQRAEDVAKGFVVSFNYDFECHHGILSEPLRTRFDELLEAVRARVRIPNPSPRALYLNAIGRDRSFWTAGERIRLDRSRVMVKHGMALYREQWSYLAVLPDRPDDAMLRSALTNTAPEDPPSPHRDALRSGAATSAALSDCLATDPVRKRINDDFLEAGLDGLTAEPPRTWDSYRDYQGDTLTAYIPIWWVTTTAALRTEMAAIGPINERARIVATALGLPKASGPYYVVELPDRNSSSHVMHKPTIFSGGIADAFCAVAPPDQPGLTARLDSGEAGLIEAVMIPLDPAVSGDWKVTHYLGVIDRPMPPANIQRIKQRLAI